MKRFRYVLVALSLALLLVAAACSSPSAPSQPAPTSAAAKVAPTAAPAKEAPTKLDFGGSVTWYGQIPIMLAVDKGFFKEQGLDVSYQTIAASADRLRAVSSGSVAFSNLGGISVIASMSRGDESFYVFANVDDSPGNEGCWGRAGINSIKDLKGKKVAANTSAEVTLHGLLKKNGMTIKDVDFVDIGASDMPLALQKGDVVAACVWQPVLDQLKTVAPDGKLLGLDTDTEIYERFGTMASSDMVIINRKLADDYPEQMRKLAAGMFKGVDFTINNPEETAKTVAHYFKKSPEEVLEQGIKKFKWYGLQGQVEHMKLQDQHAQYLAQWLKDTGKTTSVPEVSKWTNLDILPKQ